MQKLFMKLPLKSSSPLCRTQIFLYFSFRIDNTDNVIDVVQPSLPSQHAQLNMICPHYHRDTPQVTPHYHRSLTRF